VPPTYLKKKRGSRLHISKNKEGWEDTLYFPKMNYLYWAKKPNLMKKK